MVLYSRALKEITDGSMKEAQIAVQLLVQELADGESGTAAQLLAAIVGDNGVSDEA